FAWQLGLLFSVLPVWLFVQHRLCAVHSVQLGVQLRLRPWIFVLHPLWLWPLLVSPVQRLRHVSLLQLLAAQPWLGLPLPLSVPAGLFVYLLLAQVESQVQQGLLSE